MSLFSKVLIIFLFVLSAGYAGIQIVLFSQRDNYRQLYDGKQKELVAKQKELDQEKEVRDKRISDLESVEKTQHSDIQTFQRVNKNLETTNTTLRADLASQKDKLTELTNSYDRISREVETERKQNRQFQGKIKALEGDVEKHRETIRQQTAKIESLDDEKRGLQEYGDGLKTNLATANRDKEHLNRLVKMAVENGFNVDLYSVPPIDGKVLKADNGLKVVVISAGADKGVRIGHEFVVWRGSEYVGKIVVEDTQPTFASGRPVADAMRKLIQVGDNVSTRLVR